MKAKSTFFLNNNYYNLESHFSDKRLVLICDVTNDTSLYFGGVT